MAEKLTEGVGRRIVDALKQQSEIELKNVTDDTNNESIEESDFEDDFDKSFEEEFHADTISKETMINPTPMTFDNPMMKKDTFASDLDDFEVPANIAVLKQLINQLPAGVSKQTGAQIIKQTMEALGISMKSVLQEAQQVQEGLTNSTRECQNSIVEYRKQISMLEKQSQKLQKQYSALNDIISLFVQTNI